MFKNAVLTIEKFLLTNKRIIHTGHHSTLGERGVTKNSNWGDFEGLTCETKEGLKKL